MRSVLALAFMVASLAGYCGVTMDFPGRKAAMVGVKIVEIKTGKVVESENAAKAMIPASILKAVTSATVLETVGPDFRFTTPVVMQGDFDGKVFCGDVIVKASGDPTIGSSHFPESCGIVDSIVSRLVSRGVTVITGDVFVDEEDFQDQGQNPQWVIEDAGWSYGAGLFGFNYSDNTFTLYTDDLRSVPEVPFLDVSLEKTTSGTDIIHGVNSDNYLISGKNVDRSDFSVTTTMSSPSAVFVHELKKKLRKAGIQIKESETDAGAGGDCDTLYVHRSPSGIDILRSLMFRSDNMMAEAMLRSLAPGCSRKAAIEKELACWKSRGLGTGYAKIADGSGLARIDRVTPDFMADVLVYMARSSSASDYVSCFPKVGKEGTVKNFLRKTALAGRLALKSGSMNGVHCYAGYRLGRDGEPTHAVVVMVNNFFCSRDALRNGIGRWLQSVFK